MHTLRKYALPIGGLILVAYGVAVAVTFDYREFTGSLVVLSPVLIIAAPFTLLEVMGRAFKKDWSWMSLVTGSLIMLSIAYLSTGVGNALILLLMFMESINLTSPIWIVPTLIILLRPCFIKNVGWEKTIMIYATIFIVVLGALWVA